MHHDLDAVGLGSLPEAVTLSQGRLEEGFDTLEQLCESIFLLARILNDEPERFAREYEPVVDQRNEEANEMDLLFQELAKLKKIGGISL